MLEDQWSPYWAQFIFVTLNSETIAKKTLWIYSYVPKSEFSQEEFSASTI